MHVLQSINPYQYRRRQIQPEQRLVQTDTTPSDLDRCVSAASETIYEIKLEALDHTRWKQSLGASTSDQCRKWRIILRPILRRAWP